MERADYEHWSAREVARLLALVESGRRYYQEIVAVAPTGLLVVSSDLSVVMANRCFREIFGLRGQDLSRRTVEEVLPIEGFRKRLTDVFSSRQGQQGLMVETAPAEEGARTLRVDLSLFESSEEDRESEVLVFVQDVTPYARPTAVVRHTPIPDIPAVLWEADTETSQFTFVSPAAESLFGYPPDRWLSEPGFWPERIHPEDRAWMLDVYRMAAAEGRDRRCEYRGVTADGGVVWLREMIHPIRDEDGRVRKLAGVTFDNSEHRHIQEQALEAAKMEALTRMASRVGHDFNNLLMIIGGYGEELVSGLPPDDPLRAEVEEILAATDRVSRLTNQLLSFSRRVPARSQTIDLPRLLSDLAQKLRAALPDNIKLETVLSTEGLQIEADPSLIEQAISDLAGFARNSMPEGGSLTIEAATATIAEHGVAGPSLSPGDYAVVVISDTGAGVDAEARNRLFEPFAGARQFGKEPGLGLANTYRIVRHAGGDIAVISEPGRGTTIRVYLPRVAQKSEKKQSEEVTAQATEDAGVESLPAPAVQEPVARVEAAPSLVEPATRVPAEQAKPEKVPPPVEAVPMPVPAAMHETVLVVEDEEGVRALMQKILRRQGYTVIEAANGAEALDLVKTYEKTIHVLVTDVVMPQMGGRALAEQLKGVRPNIKVLYVSGFTDDAVIQSGLLPPGTAFLQKPFTLSSLLGKVRDVLSGSTEN